MDDSLSTDGRSFLVSHSSLASPASKPTPHRRDAVWEKGTSPVGGGLRMRIDGPHHGSQVPDLSNLGWQATIASFIHQAGTCENCDERSVIAGRFAELLAEAAHDMRAPLATASQVISAIAERSDGRTPLSGRDVDLLRAANQRLLQAGAWMDTILTDRRLARDAMHPAVRSRFYAHQFQQALAPLLTTIAKQYRVHIRWENWSRGLPLLYLDVNHLLRAALNLAINAIRASQPGQTVTIRAGWHPATSARFHITIEDQGPGMPPALSRYLNGLTAELPRGMSGLGLQVARDLVGKLGGVISVRCGAGGQAGRTQATLQLPTDDLEALLRDWLVRAVAHPAPWQAAPATRCEIYAIRCRDGRDLTLLDHRLQAATEKSDLVYRISLDRWLWFAAVDESGQAPQGLRTLENSSPPGSAEHAPTHVRFQRVFQSAAFRLADLRESSEGDLLQRLAGLLTAQARVWIGKRIAPVDSLEPGSLGGAAFPWAHVQLEPSRQQARLQPALPASPADAALPPPAPKPKLVTHPRHGTGHKGRHAVGVRRAKAKRRDAEISRALRQLAHEWGVQSERICWSVPHPAGSATNCRPQIDSHAPAAPRAAMPRQKSAS